MAFLTMYSSPQPVGTQSNGFDLFRAFPPRAVCDRLLPVATTGLRRGSVVTPGFGGDGGPATAAQLNAPEGLSVNADCSFLITDHFNHAIRLVSSNGTITTVAGNGTAGFSGDGGPATQAQLSSPVSVSSRGDGDFLISDSQNHVVRRVAPDGTITTVAGTPGFIGDGGAAVDA